MIIDISDYYKEKGYITAYLSINKEPRRVCTLRKLDGSMMSMSYAKYLYTSYYKCDIEKGYQVDHINNDKLDDRVENLQVISQYHNIVKNRKKQERVLLKCPVCGIEFLYPKRNISTHPEPCCSRKCGGIKSHWK